MAEVDWTERAGGLLRGELKRRRIGDRELAQLLTRMGLPTTERDLTATIDAGAFSATFLVQCFEAMGAPVINLDY